MYSALMIHSNWSLDFMCVYRTDRRTDKKKQSTAKHNTKKTQLKYTEIKQFYFCVISLLLMNYCLTSTVLVAQSQIVACEK